MKFESDSSFIITSCGCFSTPYTFMSLKIIVVSKPDSIRFTLNVFFMFELKCKI